jgi:CheY-like chemotaxis protein
MALCSMSLPHHFAGYRVLVAEDSWPLAKALRIVLADLGMSVMGPASSIAAAKVLVEEGLPDLAVVDVNLKGEMSYEFIALLKDKGVPVIAITGYAHPTNAMSRADAILQKPFGELILTTTIHRVLGTADGR